MYMKLITKIFNLGVGGVSKGNRCIPRYPVAVLLSLLASSGMAQQACPPQIKPTAQKFEAAQKNAHDHGFLWRISKDGHDSWLYGTIHIAKFEWMFPGPQVTQALQETDTMALELDVLDPSLQGNTALGVQKMRRTRLPHATVKRIRRLAEALCVPYERIADMPPELQVGMLETYMGRADGLEPEYAIDAFLAMLGHREHKAVISLETPEFQLSQLQMATSEETVKMVQEDLDQLGKDNGHGYVEKLARLWGDSDYDAMANFESWCNCMDTDIARMTMKRMLDDRNPAMADRIDKLHVSGKRVFAAVGSLHMFGAYGLPLLMERRGYRVARIALPVR